MPVLIQDSSGGGGAGGVTVGDYKAGMQPSYKGRVLLNGRALTALTASQQAAAATLGISGSLINAAGRTITQGVPGTLFGSNAISQANLPNINLNSSSVSAGTPAGSINSVSAGTPAGLVSTTINAVGDHTHGYNIPYASNARFDFNQNGGSSFGVNQGYTTGNGGGHSHSASSSFSGSTLAGHSHTFSGSALAGHSHTIPLGGSGTAFVAAAIGANIFLYLGA